MGRQMGAEGRMPEAAITLPGSHARLQLLSREAGRDGSTQRLPAIHVGEPEWVGFRLLASPCSYSKLLQTFEEWASQGELTILQV